ncbi:hypothetical protein DSECCO2_99710 [anaerobic digester metagenome]
MISAHRTGRALVFRTDAGELVGAVPMSTMYLLIPCGERVPVEGIDTPVGYAARVKDLVVVTMHGQTYHAPWHEFRRMAMLIGTSVPLTGPEKEVQSLPSRVTRPCPKSTPVLTNSPGQAREYVVIPPKKMKPRPTPSPSSYVRQSDRKVRLEV